MAKKASKKSTKPVTKAKGKPKPKAKPATKAPTQAPVRAPAKKPASKAKAASVKAKPAPVKKMMSKAAPKPTAKVTKKAPAAAVKTPVKAEPKLPSKPAAKTAAAPAPAKVAKPVKKPAPKPASAHATFTEPTDAPSPVVAMTGTPAQPNTPIEQSRAFAIEAARLLSDDKCTDIVVLDVSKLTSLPDFIIIGSGTSDRQMRSVLDDVAELGTASGHTIAHQSIDDRATWVLADFFDVVIHLFEPNTRAYYDLEMMWGDAPKVPWERAPGDKPKPRNRRIVVGAAGSQTPTNHDASED